MLSRSARGPRVGRDRASRPGPAARPRRTRRPAPMRHRRSPARPRPCGPANIAERLMQGATPEVGRADIARLDDTGDGRRDACRSRRPADVTARESAVDFSAVPGRPAGLRVADRRGPVPSEQRCLAQAIYFEARGESEKGQAAVAQVVLNRVSSGLYPRRSAASSSRTGNIIMPASSHLPARGGRCGSPSPMPGGARSMSPPRSRAAKPMSPMSATRPIITRFMCILIGREGCSEPTGSASTSSTNCGRGKVSRSNLDRRRRKTAIFGAMIANSDRGVPASQRGLAFRACRFGL